MKPIKNENLNADQLAEKLLMAQDRHQVDPEERHWQSLATWNERNAPCHDPDHQNEDHDLD